MKKEHSYVECTSCNWRVAQGQNMNEHPCDRCSNTRLMIDPKELLCNLCGECLCHDITTPSGRWSSDYPHGLYDAKVTGGYESYHLLDLNRYTFSLCEKCLRQLFTQCKIKPEVVDVGLGGTVLGECGWEQDQKTYEYRLWKDNGGHHQAYLDRKCNAIKDCPNRAVYTLLHNDTIFTEEALCEEHKDHKYSNSSLTKFIPNVLKPFL